VCVYACVRFVEKDAGHYLQPFSFECVHMSICACAICVRVYVCVCVCSCVLVRVFVQVETEMRLLSNESLILLMQIIYIQRTRMYATRSLLFFNEPLKLLMHIDHIQRILTHSTSPSSISMNLSSY